MQLFGYEISLLSKKNAPSGETFTIPQHEDGALEIDRTTSGLNFDQSMGYSLDIDSIPDSEFELLTTYRSLALQLEVDEAIQEITNEAIITDDIKPSVSVVLDDLELSDAIKDKIRDEFDYILQLLKFQKNGPGIFKKWYIDGRLFYHKVIDESSAKKGITQLIQIDPLNIQLVREFTRKIDGIADIYDLSQIEEYFIFSQSPFNTLKKDPIVHNQALKIQRDSVVYVPSGLVSDDGKSVLSYLYKAIKPFNNLKLMEDSLVIYRVSRAPERRVFYVDVGNLPKGKADQHLQDTMNRFKSKIVYDVNKGTINNRKKFQSMMEDYWLARREGTRGTEVTTLPGGDNLGELEDVEYMKNKMYRSLNVPMSRFQQDSSAFNIGRTTEITRDELTFNKSVQRLRKKFSGLFDDLLRTQLILKKIITADEWLDFENTISYSFLEDNYFQELKELEIISDRMEALTGINDTGIIGKYISHDTIRRTILRQSEEDMEDEDKKIKEEVDSDQYQPQDELGNIIQDEGEMVDDGGGTGFKPTPKPKPAASTAVNSGKQKFDDIKAARKFVTDYEKKQDTKKKGQLSNTNNGK